MDETVKEWREKHPKCIYCKYYRAFSICHDSFTECSAKQKSIFFDCAPRWFCKIYTVKES